MFKRLYALAVVSIVAVVPAAADFESGYAAFQRDRYAEAVRELKPAAEQGDPRAQYMLGVIFANGLSGEFDPTVAARWYRLAAEQDYVQAQMELARLYREGIGVRQDRGEMVKWYRRAAELGDVGAQLFVADTYAYGVGPERDLVRAYMWYEIARRYWGESAAVARDVIAEEMTAEQIAEAKRLAEKWVGSEAAPE